jgi:hypothetical protein
MFIRCTKEEEEKKQINVLDISMVKRAQIELNQEKKRENVHFLVC